MISLTNYSKNYGELSVFTNFNLEILTGQTIGIKGNSGCGKTTLLRSITGLDNDFTGELILNKKRITKNIPPHRRDVALVMQEPILWEHMTVKENILFSISLKQRKKVQDQLRNICDHLEILPILNRIPRNISGGQAKRVSFARALMSDKNILLLDEPLSNVDNETKKKILVYLKQYLSENKTIVYVSHDKEELELFCDNILEI
ncbi:MAG: ATP-binding cassette domain-containing protein [Eubacteriales bacterium]